LGLASFASVFSRLCVFACGVADFSGERVYRTFGCKVVAQATCQYSQENLCSDFIALGYQDVADRVLKQLICWKKMLDMGK
jgi:hypothetical protein